MLVLDGDGHVVWLSNEMGALCATSAALHVGDDACEIFPDASKFRREFAIRSQLRKHGFLSNMRIEVHNTGGELIPVELSILPISVDDAEKPLYVAIVRRVEGEEPRREDPENDMRSLASVLDSAPEAVLTVNERGFITYANPDVERLVGQPPERLVDQPIALLLSQRRARSSGSSRRWRPARESATKTSRCTASTVARSRSRPRRAPCARAGERPEARSCSCAT